MIIKDRITLQTLKKIEKITGGELTLGKMLWSIRKCDEISQTDFAKKLGISTQHLCDLEHDRKSISPKLAARYAKILGYSKEQFIQLALQNSVDREGLEVQVEVAPKIGFEHAYCGAH